MDPENYPSETSTKIRDLEERQRLLKDRVLLLGQNLLDIREESDQSVIILKKELETLKSEVARFGALINSIAEESGNFVRKEELAIIERQIKMFEPLNLVRLQDLDKIIEEKLKLKKS